MDTWHSVGLLFQLRSSGPPSTNPSSLGISDQIFRKVGNESGVLTLPSTVSFMLALYPPNLHLIDKETGTSEFKQVGQDLTSQSPVAGWPPHSSSVLPLLQGAAGARRGGEGAAASPLRFTAGMETPSQRIGRRWDMKAIRWRTFSSSTSHIHGSLELSVLAASSGDLGVTAKVFAN